MVIVGGSSGAVAAACEAARQGARVFLLAPRPYLGTDICATLRLWLEDGERPQSKLAVACFGTDRIATPFTVKAEMDRALLEAGVSYLTGCYVTDVLRDREGRLAGVVMASRSGRQAVRAKVIVDATCQAAVARLGRGGLSPVCAGPADLPRVVIGGTAHTGENLSVEKKSFTVDFVAQKTDHHLPVYEYTLAIDLPDNGVTSFFAAENRARDMTNGPGAEVASEVLYHVPSDTVIGEQHLDSWPGAGAADLGPFRPQGLARLYVLGAYADLGREAAGKLLRPLELMEMGTRIGRAAAAEARGLPHPDSAALPADGRPGRSHGHRRRGSGPRPLAGARHDPRRQPSPARPGPLRRGGGRRWHVRRSGRDRGGQERRQDAGHRVPARTGRRGDRGADRQLLVRPPPGFYGVRRSAGQARPERMECRREGRVAPPGTDASRRGRLVRGARLRCAVRRGAGPRSRGGDTPGPRRRARDDGGRRHRQLRRRRLRRGRDRVRHLRPRKPERPDRRLSRTPAEKVLRQYLLHAWSTIPTFWTCGT